MEPHSGILIAWFICGIITITYWDYGEGCKGVVVGCFCGFLTYEAFPYAPVLVSVLSLAAALYASHLIAKSHGPR